MCVGVFLMCVGVFLIFVGVFKIFASAGRVLRWTGPPLYGRSSPQRPAGRQGSHKMNPEKPNAHMEWSMSLNRGLHSTRRPPQTEKEQKFRWEKDKKTRNFVSPTLPGPQSSAPHPSGPPPFGLPTLFLGSVPTNSHNWPDSVWSQAEKLWPNAARLCWPTAVMAKFGLAKCGQLGLAKSGLA